MSPTFCPAAGLGDVLADTRARGEVHDLRHGRQYCDDENSDDGDPVVTATAADLRLVQALAGSETPQPLTGFSCLALSVLAPCHVFLRMRQGAASE